MGPGGRWLCALRERDRIVGRFCPYVALCAWHTNPTPTSSLSGIECFGAHLGDPQAANLGDGNGYVNQTIELRQDYGNPEVGTCWESLVGGNHLRLFRQNGPSANTGALFLAYVCLFASATDG